MGFNKRYFTLEKIIFYYLEFGMEGLGVLIKNTDGFTCDCYTSNEIVKYIFNNKLDIAENLIKQLKQT